MHEEKESDIQDPTFKICIPGRIITRSRDIRDPTLKKRNREMNKVISTISSLEYTNKMTMSMKTKKGFL